MSFYTFTAEARKDLNEIIEYIARNHPSAAVNFVKAIDQKCENLAKFPNMGKSYQNIAPQLRGVPLSHYMIFYRPIENGIEVIRLLSGYRNLKAIFQGEDDS